MDQELELPLPPLHQLPVIIPVTMFSCPTKPDTRLFLFTLAAAAPAEAKKEEKKEESEAGSDDDMGFGLFD